MGSGAGVSAAGDEVVGEGWSCSRSSCPFRFFVGRLGSDIRPRFFPLPFAPATVSSFGGSSSTSGSASTAARVARRPLPFLVGTGGGGISAAGEAATDERARSRVSADSSLALMNARPFPLPLIAASGRGSSAMALPLPFANVVVVGTDTAAGAANSSDFSCACRRVVRAGREARPRDGPATGATCGMWSSRLWYCRLYCRQRFLFPMALRTSRNTGDCSCLMC